MRWKYFIFFILAVSFVLRVWALDLVPTGFTPDEASFGYDAYSILKTGKDQWGHALPLVLESFGDFKLPLYTYLTIPSVAVFGLSKFAVRLPNALLGTFAVYVTFLLVYQLFKKQNQKDSLLIANIAASLLSISPWHIMMSRGAFEANLTTILMPLAIFLFLKGIGDKKFLLYSSIVFGLNLFSYHSARLVTPLVVIFLVLIYMKHFKEGLFNYKLPVFVFLLFLVTAFYTLIGGGARRAQDIMIFSGALNQASDERFTAIYQGMSEGTARLFHNKYQVTMERFLENYSQYTSSNFWFINGPSEATYGMLPGYGVIYLFELPFLIAFLYSFLILKDKKPFYILLFWILIAPVPAALTMGRGYAGNRSVIMLPALTIASAIGAYTIYSLIKKRLSEKITGVIFSGMVIIILPFFFSFLEKYYVISPSATSQAMLYGNLEVAKWLSQNSENRKEVVVSKSLSEPHIYIAFANKWDPNDYQENTKEWLRYKSEGLKFLDQLDSYSLGKFTFSSIDYGKYQNRKDVLLVGKPNEFPPEARPLIKFINPDGVILVEVVEPFSQAYAQKDNHIFTE